MGRADLVTLGAESVEIVDYKTGAPHPSHADQLRIYALLWYRDADLNPSGKRVSRLSIAYPTDDVTVEPPAPDELAELESQLQLRTSAVRDSLSGRPPEARPSTELCATCPVRHLCEEYWDFLPHQGSALSELPENGPAWGVLGTRFRPDT
jgi:CRISPR/Cas system-associated exonuclease Cas4 (RecB family)